MKKSSTSMVLWKIKYSDGDAWYRLRNGHKKFRSFKHNGCCISYMTLPMIRISEEDKLY